MSKTKPVKLPEKINPEWRWTPKGLANIVNEIIDYLASREVSEGNQIPSQPQHSQETVNDVLNQWVDKKWNKHMGKPDPQPEVQEKHVIYPTKGLHCFGCASTKDCPGITVHWPQPTQQQGDWEERFDKFFWAGPVTPNDNFIDYDGSGNWVAVAQDIRAFISKELDLARTKAREEVLEEMESKMADHYWDSLTQSGPLVMKHFRSVLSQLKKGKHE